MTGGATRIVRRGATAEVMVSLILTSSCLWKKPLPRWRYRRGRHLFSRHMQKPVAHVWQNRDRRPSSLGACSQYESYVRSP